MEKLQNFILKKSENFRPKRKKIVKKQKITNSLANKLFVELTENVINEPIKVEKNCGDFYLDGDYLSFSIKKDGKTVNELVLAEVYPESESNVEKNQCRRKKKILVTYLDNDLNLKKRHAEIFKKLPNLFQGTKCKNIYHRKISYFIYPLILSFVVAPNNSTKKR